MAKKEVTGMIKLQIPGGQATPATYLHEGRQYVVIAAGGHPNFGTTPGDHIVAWALPADP